jgi:RNA recognition motif-containing protein
MEAPVGHRVFVGGISWKADEVQLENFFSSHGQVLECKIIMDRITGKSRGYGFVTFKDATSAEYVKRTANFNFLGKNMNVGDAVRKASEPNGTTNNGARPPHGNYNNGNGYHQPFYNHNNYYSRHHPPDAQFYGHYSPDGTFYPVPYFYPQGFRGNPQQYQYGGQNGYPQGYPSFSQEGDPSQTAPTDSTSPPSYPAYTPYSPNGNANYTPYYNNTNNNGNYYNAYYYPYPAGGYPASYGYNQNYNPAQPEGEEAGAADHPPASSESTTQPTPDHVNITPPTSDHATAPATDTPGIDEPTPAPSSDTPTADGATDNEPQQAATPPQPTPQRPKTYASESPAQGRSQWGQRNSPKLQQQRPQQPRQRQQKMHTRGPSQDALHGHVISSLSKLSVSSN